jgi:hypothetical protein
VISIRRAALALLLMQVGTHARAATVGDEVVMPNFALLDQDGRSREVARTDAEAIVVAIVCGAAVPQPCAAAPLGELRAKFGPKGVAFWMMSSRLGETRESLRASAVGLGADTTFPLLHDEAQIVARALGATRQGEAFVIDRRRRRVFFRGSLGEPKALERALGAFLHHGARPRAAGPGDGAPLALTPADKAPVSYANDIAPLVRRKCVPCHRAGDVGPFAFDGHRAFEGWGATVQEVLLARRMPPWHADAHAGGPFSNDVSLTPVEIDRLWRYIEQGAPLGDGPDPLAAPAPPVLAWPLGKPDYVVEIPAVEHIPPTGVIPYQNRVSTFVMPRDAWLSGAFVQPDNRAVVHHVTIYAEYPKGYKPEGEDSYLSGWAPGMELGAFPPGTGKFVPKGTAFRFEIHYTPDGKPEDDRTRLGLYVSSAKGPPPRRLETRFAWDEDLLVPAGEPELRTHAVYGLEHAALLYDLIPHMHNRGSWVKYEALYPDGRRETLLSVPRYDFAWQRVYRLARPKALPAGTWILITAGYDNSALNPANPDPRRAARWGEQTWDEMFVPQLDVVRAP